MGGPSARVAGKREVLAAGVEIVRSAGTRQAAANNQMRAATRANGERGWFDDRNRVGEAAKSTVCIVILNLLHKIDGMLKECAPARKG